MATIRTPKLTRRRDADESVYIDLNMRVLFTPKERELGLRYTAKAILYDQDGIRDIPVCDGNGHVYRIPREETDDQIRPPRRMLWDLVPVEPSAASVEVQFEPFQIVKSPDDVPDYGHLLSGSARAALFDDGDPALRRGFELIAFVVLYNELNGFETAFTPILRFQPERLINGDIG